MKNKNRINDVTNNNAISKILPFYTRPLFLFSTLVVLIFIIEFSIMMLLYSNELSEAILDSSILSVILIPFLYLIYLKPMKNLLSNKIINERKLMYSNEQLRLFNIKYLDLYDNAPNTYFSVSVSDGNILMCNKASEKLLGYTKEELVFTSVLDLYADNPFGKVKAKAVFEKLKLGIVTNNAELQMKHKSGETVWVSLSVIPLFDNDGNVTESRSIVTDISKLKNAETKYRTLFDNIPLMVFTKDINSVYKTCNELFSINFNINKEDFAGQNDYDYFPKEIADKFRENDKKVMVSGKTETLEEKFILNNEERLALVVKTPTFKSSGECNGILGTAMDITERKMLEHKLNEQIRHVALMEKKLFYTEKMVSIGQVASGLSHEINQPLGAILLTCEILKHDVENKNYNRINKLSTKVIEQISRISNLINALNTFSRSGLYEKPSQVNLYECIDTILILMQEQFKKENITIDLDVKDKTLCIQGIRNEIERVLLNILNNAIYAVQFKEDKKLISVSSSIIDSECVITISDNGMGISEENIESIFEPFYTTKEIGAGTGLGLSICYGIVGKSNGSIVVESEFGKGSIFKIILPSYNVAKEVEL